MNVFILQKIVYGNSYSPYWIHAFAPEVKLYTHMKIGFIFYR